MQPKTASAHNADLTGRVEMMIDELIKIEYPRTGELILARTHYRKILPPLIEKYFTKELESENALLRERLKPPSPQEIRAAIKHIGKESTAPDRETPLWLETDIRRGMRWMYERITGQKFPDERLAAKTDGEGT